MAGGSCAAPRTPPCDQGPAACFGDDAARAIAANAPISAWVCGRTRSTGSVGEGSKKRYGRRRQKGYVPGVPGKPTFRYGVAKTTAGFSRHLAFRNPRHACSNPSFMETPSGLGEGTKVSQSNATNWGPIATGRFSHDPNGPRAGIL